MGRGRALGPSNFAPNQQITGKTCLFKLTRHVTASCIFHSQDHANIPPNSINSSGSARRRLRSPSPPNSKPKPYMHDERQICIDIHGEMYLCIYTGHLGQTLTNTSQKNPNTSSNPYPQAELLQVPNIQKTCYHFVYVRIEDPNSHPNWGSVRSSLNPNPEPYPPANFKRQETCNVLNHFHKLPDRVGSAQLIGTHIDMHRILQRAESIEVGFRCDSHGLRVWGSDLRVAV